MAMNIFFITLLLTICTSTTLSVLYFPVNYLRYSPWIGFYVTRVKLGNPQKEFTLKIDTGSNMFWIACNGCAGCPSSSGFYGIELKFYDPSKSSTSSPIRCSEPKCTALHAGNMTCLNSHSNYCNYFIQYPHNISFQGYYVSDTMHIARVTGLSDIMHIDTAIENSSIIFGCNMLQSGASTDPKEMFDGLFGLGNNGLVLSQLSSTGVVPKMFTLCLDGSEKDASFLYFGEIDNADIIYTSLIPSESHYCMNLRSIDVNNQRLNVNSSISTTPAIVDSVVTFTYLPHETYVHFINAITSFLKPEIVQPYKDFAKYPCFTTRGSIHDSFPTVKLHFARSAIMTLYPKNYLMLHTVDNSSFKWCMTLLNSGFGGKTVLGDMALKDKLLVHDMVNKRFGWKDQECSASVRFPSGQNSTISSLKNYKTLVISGISIAVFLLVILILSICYVHRCR